MSIQISDLRAMRTLVDGMQDVGRQSYDLQRYATTWVTQKAGFEPSPVCALRPFARAMDVVEEAMNDAFTMFRNRWEDMTEGVAATIMDFERHEGRVVDDMSSLLHRVGRDDRPGGGMVSR